MKEKATSVRVRAGCLCAHPWHSYSMFISLDSHHMKSKG